MKAKTIAFISNMATSTTWIFIPLLAKELGASDALLGLIGTAFGISVFFSSYYFGRLSDRIGRKRVLQSGLLLSSIAFILLVFADSPQTLLFLRFLTGFTVGMYPPVLIAYVNDRRGKLGKFASFQSLGWATGTLLAGLLASYFRAFLTSSMLFFLAFLFALRLDDSSFKPQKVQLFPVKMIKKNIGVYLGYFTRHLGAQSVWIVFPVYLSSIGVSTKGIGILFSINSVIQFLVMQSSDRFDPRKLVPFGFSLAGVAFLIMATASGYWQFFFGMMLIGVSWGSSYSGSIRYLSWKNKEMGTSMGMLQSAISLSNTLGPIIGGTLSQLSGNYAVPIYFACTASFTGALIFLTHESGLKRRGKMVRWNGEV